MRACIILHNMIIEDERDNYTQYDISQFQQLETCGSAQVDLTYFTNKPTNMTNILGNRTPLRDRNVHHQLKSDLVEYIWQNFGTLSSED